MGRKLGEFADLVRNRRKEYDLTLADVAERTELTVPRVSALERNVEQPTYWEVMALAKALNLHSDNLRRAADVQLGKAKPHVMTARNALNEALNVLNDLTFTNAVAGNAHELIEQALWALDKEATQP